MKIAHFLLDTIQGAAAVHFFEEVNPGKNDFFIWVGPEGLRFLKDLDATYLDLKTVSSSEFAKRIDTYELVIFHSLISGFEKVLIRVKSQVPVLWIGWGGDYYDLIWDDPGRLYFRETRFWLAKNRFGSWSWQQPFRSLVKRIQMCLGMDSLRKRRLNAIRRVDYFSPALESEFDLLKRKFSRAFERAKFIDWWYSSCDFTVDFFPKPAQLGDSILVGNNSFPSNNLLETIDWLAKMPESKNRKMIFPVSYGDAGYQQAVLQKGQKILGDLFFPLTEIISKADYFSLLATCSHAVFMHRRQHAGGAVLGLLSIGTRIIFPGENLIYRYLIQRGVVVNSVEEVNKNPKLLKIPLTPSQIESNRKIILEIKGKSWAVNQMTNFLELLKT